MVKWIWFPHVDERFFSLDYQRLQSAPARLLILRPTKFPDTKRSGTLVMPERTESGRYDPNRLRLVGRNVSFGELIATAYRCEPSQVFVPTGTPTNGFDFLVTVRDKPVEKLQSAIRRKSGYTASWKQHAARVLLLKVKTRNSSGLKPSTATGGSANYRMGKLYFQHAPVQEIVNIVQDRLKTPVVDQTGLNGFYDFVMDWPGPGRSDPTEAMTLDSLADMGLTLVEDSDWLNMMVVEKAP